jgi:hypothetical protein
MLVEELLELLIDIVDANLLKTIEIKISNPAISRTPMYDTFFMVGSMRVMLHLSTTSLNVRS